MELTLWRWSLGVQVSSTLLIMMFFLALQRSLPRDAMTAWVRGWVLNLAALAVALLSWVFIRQQLFGPQVMPMRPEVAALTRSVATLVPHSALFIHLAAKTVAVLYLAQGAWALVRHGLQVVAWPQLLVAGLIYPLFAASVLNWFSLIGAGQQLFTALMFLPTALALFRSRDRALGWLAFAFFARGILCLFESAAYVVQALPADDVAASLRRGTGLFLAVHSAFDSATEWLLALGFVLALSMRSQQALELSIGGLHAAQEELRRLVDHDPLTGLSNRRALQGILRAAQPEGATILFLDLDDFKRVNDEMGHEIGDQSLKRFANALRASFRPEDSFVRYGGDEFVVVARGLSRDLAESRVEDLRSRIFEQTDEVPGLKVSVGIAELPPGGHPEDALRRADGSMYEAKSGRSVA